MIFFLIALGEIESPSTDYETAVLPLNYRAVIFLKERIRKSICEIIDGEILISLTTEMFGLSRVLQSRPRGHLYPRPDRRLRIVSDPRPIRYYLESLRVPVYRDDYAPSSDHQKILHFARRLFNYFLSDDSTR